LIKITIFISRKNDEKCKKDTLLNVNFEKQNYLHNFITFATKSGALKLDRNFVTNNQEETLGNNM
jgi:hypothetical protein